MTRSFGSGGRWQTCIHVSGEGQVLLVDCGATSLVALKAQGLNPNAVDAVAVTRLHGDHFGGLPFLILAGQFSRRSTPLQVAGPPGIRARLAEAMEVLFPGSSQAQRRFPVQVTELHTCSATWPPELALSTGSYGIAVGGGRLPPWAPLAAYSTHPAGEVAQR